MKANKKQFINTISFGLILVVVFFGGCKKEISTERDDPTLNVKMATDGKGSTTKVLRQSPGLKIEATGQKINRISEKLRYPEKLEAALNAMSKKKKDPGITVSDASFSATLSGTVYNCSIDFPDLTGDKEFWLVNTLTWVYTYATASSTSYATFNTNKPLLPGTYRVYGEDAYSGTQFSNEITLGDAYSGVSLTSGYLSFTDQAAYDAIVTRLETAYEAHQTYIDQFNSLSDDDTDAALISTGFDQFLPYKEFEAWFGISSLRAQIQGECDYWYTQTHTDMSTYPDDNYFPYSYEEQTLMTTGGVIAIGGEGPFTLPTTSGLGWQDPQNPGSNTCMFQAKKNAHENYGDNRTVRKKVLISKWDNGATKWVGNSQTFKKRWWGPITPAIQRQRTKVYGNWYSPTCVYEGTFDSGLTNASNNKRFAQRAVEKKAVDDLASKSGEWSMAVTISTESSTPFVQTYTH